MSRPLIFKHWHLIHTLQSEEPTKGDTSAGFRHQGATADYGHGLPSAFPSLRVVKGTHRYWGWLSRRPPPRPSCHGGHPPGPVVTEVTSQEAAICKGGSAFDIPSRDEQGCARRRARPLLSRRCVPSVTCGGLVLGVEDVTHA